MIIIKMQGGLGNQLFLYGLYRELLFLGREVKIDDVAGFEDDPLREPVLSKLGISYENADKSEICEMRDSYMDPLSRIRRKIFGRKNKDYYEPLDGNFDESVLEIDDIYLNGYFQSEKYFADNEVGQELRKQLFKAGEALIEKPGIQDLRKEILSTNSVSLHIRRGDYLSQAARQTYGGICTDDYYKKAMDYIKSKNPDSVFYVFSNDIDWCKERYRNEKNIRFVSDYEFASSIDDDKDFAEFFLMSECRNHILANSSYSWWAAFLGSDDVGRVSVVPSKWTNTRQMKDIYSPWMTII